MFKSAAVLSALLAVVVLAAGLALRAADSPATLARGAAGAKSGSPPLEQLKVQLPKDVRPFPEPLLAGQKEPGFKFRGTKGLAWTPAQYLEEVPVLAKYKMNFLMNCYASLFTVPVPGAFKNEWWKPLPDTLKQGYAKVIRACRDRGIIFCFAAHPQLCSPRPLDPTSADDLNQFYQHYAWAQSKGVKWFSVSLDDVTWGKKGPAEGGSAHAKLVNTILARLRAKDPEAQMIFCPVPYWGDGTKPEHRAYLEALGKELHPDVYVFWTGDVVVASRITRKAAESYKSIVKHRMFLWDNYPENEFAATLNLGPVTGRDAELCEVIDGYMSNPHGPQNQINRIPLLTCADYAYNPKMYDPARSIGQAITHLAETDAQREALKDMVEAYPGMLRFGTSTAAWSPSNAINPVVDRFSSLVKTKKIAEADYYVRRMEDLASRLDAAFPGKFDDAKKTLKANITQMKKTLAGKKER